MHIARRIDAALDALDRGRRRLGVSVRTLLFVTLGLAALAGSLAVFAGATEDVTQHNGLATHDAARLHFFTAHRSDVVIRLSKLVSTLGSPAVLAVLALVAGALFWRRGLRLAVALAPAFALGVAGATAAVVKSIVGRARPPVSLHLVTESNASFPSGHTTDSAAVAIAIALVLAVFVLRRPLARVASLAVGGLFTSVVGMSRLVLGVHWPSDVLAGLALGVAVSLAATMTAALFAHLSPPPMEQSTRVRRSWARVAHLLTRRRQAAQQELLAA